MNSLEAIRRIKEHNEIHSKKERQAVLITIALDMAIEALERQIPAEIGFDTYGCYIYSCPVCNNPINKRHKYCSECGKALTWKKRIQGELKNETKN